MTEYIYFVKCPDCDDESFMFFDEAKDFAISCLSRKPIITQTEVQRNDFGECTDYCDLGTKWSWEEAVGDVTCDEPATKIFTSGDFKEYNPDCDPEFAGLDNTFDTFSDLDTVPDNFRRPVKSNHDELTEDYVNKFIIVGEKEDYSKQFYNVEAKEWVAKSEDATLFDNRNAAVEVLHDLDPVYFYTTHITIKHIPVAVEESTRKPIPEGMSIESLVETLEEHEDVVECKTCYNLFPKADCAKHDHGYVCPTCNESAEVPTSVPADETPALQEDHDQYSLIYCPECDTNNLDPEINICNNCGFKL